MLMATGSAGRVPNHTSLSPRISREVLGWELTVTARSASEIICGGSGRSTSHIPAAPTLNDGLRATVAEKLFTVASGRGGVGSTPRARIIGDSAGVKTLVAESM